jgi:rhodanese-related sulfurtransferase
MDTKDIDRITCQELKEMIDNHKPIVIVDTRENNSYAKAHVAGAVNIVYDLTADPMEREIRLAALPSDIPLVFYCD